MCLLIMADAGQRITDTHLLTAWENNPDGGGFAFIDRITNEVTVRKHDDPFEFVADYDRYHSAFGDDSPFLIHFRWATHGKTDLTNVHPFRVDPYTVFGHNGMIDCLMYKDDPRSDTAHFVEDYLSKLPPDWLDDKQLTDLVETFIAGSKMVALTVDPDLKCEWYILNEADGDWSEDYDGKVWFSNGSHKRAKVKTPALGYGSGGWGHGWDDYLDKRYGPVDTKPGAKDEPETDDLLILADGQWSFKCDLCYDACHVDAVCFDCDWCTECGTDLWTCTHSADEDLLDAYMEYSGETESQLVNRVLGIDHEELEATVAAVSAASGVDDPDDDTYLDPSEPEFYTTEEFLGDLAAIEEAAPYLPPHPGSGVVTVKAGPTIDQF